MDPLVMLLLIAVVVAVGSTAYIVAKNFALGDRRDAERRNRR